MIKKPILEPTPVDVLIDIETFYTTYAYVYSPTFKFDGEIHNCWEILFVNGGEVIAGVENEDFLLKKDQIIIHAPNELHRVAANNMSCSVGVITFSVKGEGEILNGIKDRVLDISDLEKNYILNIINEGSLLMSGKNYMQNVPHSRDKLMPIGIGQYMKNATEMLLISLLRRHGSTNSVAMLETLTFNKNNIVNSVIDYINNNLDKKLTLNAISEYTGYSISYISSIFKKHVNTSLISYFLSARIERAKELIEEDKLSFKEISDMLGFDSVQYFSTQFKKLTHITPSQYQAICKNSNLKKFKYGDITRFVH